MGKEKGTDNKNSKSLGKEKGTDNKNSKSLRVKDLLFLLSLAFWGPRWERRRGFLLSSAFVRVIFVVFGLLGAQVGKEKGTDWARRRGQTGFVIFVAAFWGPRWARRRGQTTKIANP